MRRKSNKQIQLEILLEVERTEPVRLDVTNQRRKDNVELLKLLKCLWATNDGVVGLNPPAQLRIRELQDAVRQERREVGYWWMTLAILLLTVAMFSATVLFPLFLRCAQTP